MIKTKEFFHVSFDTDHLKSFMNDGIRSIGQGVGGQTNGFYVFLDKATALSHTKFIRDLGNQDLSSPFALIIGMRISEENLKYPLWQFDTEHSLELSQLITKYSDQFIGLRDIPYFDGQTNKTVSVLRKDPKNQLGFILECPVFGPIKGEVSSHCYCSGIEMTGAWQALCDHVCQKNPQFIEDYNQLLKQSQCSALKYTGKTPLQPSYISLIEIKPKTIQEVEVLYTDHETRQDQICPFFKLHNKIKSR